MNITPGTTDVIDYVFLQDSTTGLAKTGLAYNSAGASAYYTRPGAAATAITLATQTVTGAHADGGFVEVDATNAKGLYRIDYPDAVCAVSPAMPYVIVSIEFDGVKEVSKEIGLGTHTNVTMISDDATAATNLEAMFDGTGYAGGTTKLGVDVVSISGDTTAADNAELMFDGTGYAGGTTKLGVDVVSISGDTTAADNAELMFDGTGYAGGTTKLGVNMVAISGDTTAADNLEEGATAIVTGAAIAGTLSTAQMSTDLTEATDDHYNGRVIAWTSGTLLGQASTITDYNGTSKVLTYDTTTDAPSAADTFVIV